MPAPTSSRQPLLLRLKGNVLINVAIKTLKVNRLADAFMARWPLARKTPGGLDYQVSSTASLIAASEIFNSEDYRGPLRGAPIRRFVDLGCNVGYFPLLLADLTGSREIEGLMLDGNATVVDEAKGHLRTNGLGKVEAILGLAGFPKERKEADFFVNLGAHIASTATGVLNPEVPSAGKSVKITVPCLDVGAAWVERFGDVPIDILKVDIEGMELELFRQSPDLLARAQRLLFEWHKWQVSLEDCRAILTAAGFGPLRILSEDNQHGVAYCQRQDT